MSKMHPLARGQLTSVNARDAARQKQAEQVQQELDAEAQALKERTERLRALRLAQEGTEPEAT